MAIQQMSASEIASVAGGGNITSAIVAYIVEKALDAAAAGISSLNQGGSPQGSDALGDLY
jgi:hypothetical protein